jgi:riboflavin kinase/FMN adenylyltransferase
MRVAIGKFDCVHKGHRELLRNADAALIITKNVNSILHDKIKRCGIKKIIILEFQVIKDLSYEEFFNKHLKGKYSEIIVGYNFKFGKNRIGNAKILSELCKINNIKCKVIPPILLGNKPISSTRIKKRLTSNVKFS